MLVSADTHPEVRVYDCRGTEICGVLSYDTDTQELEVALLLGKRVGADSRNGGSPLFMTGEVPADGPDMVRICIVLPGSYAKDGRGELIAPLVK